NYYFISGCEPSGDLLARDLVVALKEIWPEMRACGIAGPAMREAGVIPLAAMEDLTVMGFVEVLKHLKNIKQIETNVLERAVRLNPRCAILVDYPGFHFKLAERLKGRGIPVCQYVAPQLWAWGEKRTATLRQVTD